MSIYDEVFLWFLCGASFIIASIYTYARIKYHEVYITWVLLWWLLTVLCGTMIPMTKALLRRGRIGSITSRKHHDLHSRVGIRRLRIRHVLRSI